MFSIIEHLRSKFEKTSALAISGAIGVVLATLAMWAFAAIADAIAEKSRLANLDERIAQFTELHNTEAGESLFAAFSLLGSAGLVVLVIVVAATLFARRERARAIGLVSAGVSGLLLNYLLKSLFRRGRPESASEFIHRASWSFPSGHAMNSTICYGFMLFLFLRHAGPLTSRGPYIAGTMILVTLIAFSRVYLGVHYLSDVVGGVLAGSVWLLTCVSLYEIALSRWRPITGPVSS